MVSTQAQRILVVTPQRTALTRWLAPAPMMHPVMTWVVETGIPRNDDVRIVAAAPVSAAKPWIGLRSMILVPIVLMMRPPPAAVPIAIAVAQASLTQMGTANLPPPP